MSSPERQDFRLVHRLRVRWAEVDQQRIVFNPHYLMYLDTAFTEYWRALAIPYDAIPTMLGGDMYVKKSILEYHGSARLDDLLDGAPAIEFTLRFAFSNPDMDTTIVGTANPNHLQANLDALAKGPLPADVYAEALRRLDAAERE